MKFTDYTVFLHINNNKIYRSARLNESNWRINICKLKTNRQCNGQAKRSKVPNNDLQRSTQKTNDCWTRIPLKLG